MRKINVGRFEGYLRIIIGSVLFAAGTHGSWFIIPLGVLMMLTGITSYCPVHSMLKIDTDAAKENYYLSYLPRYNPDPLFIFHKTGNLAFKNRVAKESFKEINTISDLISNNISDLRSSIDENEFRNFKIIGDDNRTYSITVKGSKEIDGIIAYLRDITELIKLDQEIISTQKEIVYTMGEIGESRSKETGNHVRRVAEYSYLLAKHYGLSEEESSLLKLASPMHDIGKVAIPDAVLNKPGKLNSSEFEIMRNHARLGFDMLSHSERPILKTAAIVANEHHEKWDGTGYPNKKEGNSIHIYGRITAIADVFDALGSDRVYKKAWPIEEIIALLKQEKGKHFEPRLVDLFLGNIEQFLEIRKNYID